MLVSGNAMAYSFLFVSRGLYARNVIAREGNYRFKSSHFIRALLLVQVLHLAIFRHYHPAQVNFVARFLFAAAAAAAVGAISFPMRTLAMMAARIVEMILNEHYFEVVAQTVMIRPLFLRENQTLAMVHDKVQIPRLGL